MLGAHPDDIEIGCGGTLLRLVPELAPLEVRWLVLSGEGERAQEAVDSAEAFLGRGHDSQVEVRSFRDGFFPWEGAAIKEAFEELKGGFAPVLFVPLDEATAARKVELLLADFPSQLHRQWFRADTFWSVMRLRGLESNSPTGYAEGFDVRKVVLPSGTALAVDHDADPQPR